MHKFLTPMNEVRKPAKPREPLFEYRELHSQLGVLPGQFHRAATRAAIPMPIPRLAADRRKWYAMSDIRPWWEAIGGNQAACSEHAERNRTYRERYLSGRSAKSVLTDEITMTA
jgi:hypothetical protein